MYNPGQGGRLPAIDPSLSGFQSHLGEHEISLRETSFSDCRSFLLGIPGEIPISLASVFSIV